MHSSGDIEYQLRNQEEREVGDAREGERETETDVIEVRSHIPES